MVSTRHLTAKSAVFLRPYKAARTEGKTHKSSDLTVTVVEKLFEFQPSPRVANSRNRWQLETNQVPVVQSLDSATHQINRYPAEKC